MIFDYIFKFFFLIFDMFLSPLDVIQDIHLNIHMVDTVIDCFKVVTYILPVSKLLPILGMIILIYAWRAIISILKTLWDIIPFT